MGTGTEKLKRFYWNVDAGKCKKFKYTGEGGNENNFESKDECLEACKTGKF